MVSKRAHTKSRTGCQQCKRRHIKCDEQTPCCRNCANRGLDCEYSYLRGAIDALQLITPETYHPKSSYDSSGQSARLNQARLKSSSLSEPRVDDPWSTPILNLTDLGLFHNYLLRTYRTNGPEGEDHTVWQDDVPRLALSHPFLLYAILALSAAHQTSQESIANGESERLARQHYDSALKGFQASFEKSHSPEKIAIFRSFTVIISVLFLYWECERPSERNAIDTFSSLLTLLHNSKAVLNHSSDEDMAESIAIDVLPSGSPGRSPSPLSADLQLSLQKLQSEFLPHTCNQMESATLSRAYSALITYHFFVLSKPLNGSGFLMWPLSLDAGVGALRNRRDPLALCMLAHWCVPLCNAPTK